MALAAVLWILGERQAPMVLLGVAVGLVLLGALWPTGAGALDRFVNRVAEGIGNTIGWVLTVAAWAIILVPMWVLSRLTGVRPLDTGWDRPESAWLRVQHGPDDDRSIARRMSSKEIPAARSVRRRRRIRRAAFVLVALLAAGVAFKALGGPRAITPGGLSVAGLPVTDYAHEEEPWFRDYARELNQPMNLWDPYIGTSLRSLDGRYLNIRDGHRVTWQPDDPTLEVWYFGGSTMFGLGQRDDHTIPSVIARRAAADGIGIRSVNFGISSFVNWQETEQLEQALTLYPPPDLIVFYDGINETSLSYQRLELGDDNPDSIARQLLDDEERALFMTGRAKNEVPADRSALEMTLAARQYGRGVELGTRLAASYDVPVMFFWQPAFISKRPAAADAELIERLDLDRGFLAVAGDQYRQVLAMSESGSIDVSDALDEVTAPVYFDWGHTNELGARIIGERLYEEMGTRLRELESAG